MNQKLVSCHDFAKSINQHLRPELPVGEGDGEDVGAELGAMLDIMGGEFSVYCGLDPMESAEKKG